MTEFEQEPARGLPGLLPAGEMILWQGSPTWWKLAIEAFHARKVAIYFAVLIAWGICSAAYDGEIVRAGAGTLWLLAFAGGATGILLLLAWVASRSTVYTITNHRVVIRHGIALPLAVNLPFRSIGAAAARNNADGTGDIALSISGSDRVAWLVMWPHTRPWRVTRSEPMLRAIPEVQMVAGILAAALAQAADQSAAGSEQAIAAQRQIAPLASMPAATARTGSVSLGAVALS